MILPARPEESGSIFIGFIRKTIKSWTWLGAPPSRTGQVVERLQHQCPLIPKIPRPRQRASDISPMIDARSTRMLRRSPQARRPPGYDADRVPVLGPGGSVLAEVWQLIDGEPVAMAPASETHAALQAEIGALLCATTCCRPRQPVPAARGQPGIVPKGSCEPQLPDPRSRRHLRPACIGPDDRPDPILLIEILSPSNEAETRANIWVTSDDPERAGKSPPSTARGSRRSRCAATPSGSYSQE